MKERLSAFWQTFWGKIVKTFDKRLRKEKQFGIQEYSDTENINLLSAVVTKLTNLAMIEATFDVESDSTVAEPLKELCKGLEDKRFEITSQMLGLGDYAVFPATDRNGNLFNSFLDGNHFVISRVDGENIAEIYGIIDEYCDNKGKSYKLIRHHRLEQNGDLFVEVFTVNNTWERDSFEYWRDKQTAVVFQNANHIGVGFYKSPVTARGESNIRGVALNYGCAEIEGKIFEDIANRDTEMNNGKSILFADEQILTRSNEGGNELKNSKGFKIIDNIFRKRNKAGATGTDIDVYNPNLRIVEYTSKLNEDLALYEMQLGLSKGILTEAEATQNATATEINTSNANTVSMLNNIQNAIDKGNVETLKADGIYLNIPEDLWAYKSDYYNAFENPAEQWQRLSEAVDKGAAEVSDLTQWLFPKMTAEEIEEKLSKIKEKQTVDTDAAIERALMGA